MKKRFIGVLVLAVVIFTGACSGKKNTNNQEVARETVKIAYLPITHSLPIFAEAELQKDNPAINIELIKYGSWPELMDALNTGRIDGAIALIELTMKAKEQGIDLKAVALGHTDGNVIIARNEINSPADLKGKPFAIPHRQSSHHILLRQMLANAGMVEQDISIVELPPPEMPSALANGSISGYCVAEPFGARAVVLGAGKVLYYSEELWPDSLCCSLVLNNDFIKNKSAAAKELVSKYGEAGKHISSNRDEEERIAAEYLGVDKKVLDLSLQWISYANLKITPKIYSDLTDKVKTFGLSQNPPTYENFVLPTLLNN
ncbi:NLPA lipoprotein [Spirochaetia bacterium]|nr:NLPA lipoprotein [Spirochaetia bacterium]